MDQKRLKSELEKLTKQVGPQRVLAALLAEGLSPRHCEKLTLGDHTGKFRRKTVAAVEAVLSKRDVLLKVS